MDTMEAIYLRRSVRRYTARPISNADLAEIIQAGLMAPSGINLQPWYIVALKSEEKRKQFLQLMPEVCEQITPELEERFAKHPEVIRETTKFIRSLGNAPAILLAFMGRDDYAERETVIQGVAAAVENMLLAARDRDIASCWISAPVQAGYSGLIRDTYAPGKGDLVAVVTLGYAAQWPEAPVRRTGKYVIL